MAKLVECIPNFSEGCNREIISALEEEVKKVAGVKLLNTNVDANYNRCVLTFVGEPGPIETAAYNCVAKAAELIDMEKHHGQHPRIGATDVIPFIPVSEITMEECVVLANSLAAKIGAELQIPVYMYEEAAKRPKENYCKMSGAANTKP